MYRVKRPFSSNCNFETERLGERKPCLAATEFLHACGMFIPQVEFDAGVARRHRLSCSYRKNNLIGRSSGSAVMSLHTTLDNDKVNKLALYAPQCLRTSSGAALIDSAASENMSRHS